MKFTTKQINKRLQYGLMLTFALVVQYIAGALFCSLIYTSSPVSTEQAVERSIPEAPVVGYSCISIYGDYSQGAIYADENITRSSIANNQIRTFRLSSIISDDVEQMVYCTMSFLSLSYDTISEDSLRDALTMVQSGDVDAIALNTTQGYALTVSSDFVITYNSVPRIPR